MSIAYQVIGDGPGDLILAPGFVSHAHLACGFCSRHWGDYRHTGRDH